MHVFGRELEACESSSTEANNFEARSLLLRYTKITGIEESSYLEVDGEASEKVPPSKNGHDSSRDGKISPLPATLLANMDIFI